MHTQQEARQAVIATAAPAETPVVKSLRQRYHELKKLPFQRAIERLAGPRAVAALRAAVDEAARDYHRWLANVDDVKVLRDAITRFGPDDYEMVTGQDRAAALAHLREFLARILGAKTKPSTGRARDEFVRAVGGAFRAHAEPTDYRRRARLDDRDALVLFLRIAGYRHGVTTLPSDPKELLRPLRKI
jgi:hypothetical protein